MAFTSGPLSTPRCCFPAGSDVIGARNLVRSVLSTLTHSPRNSERHQSLSWASSRLSGNSMRQFRRSLTGGSRSQGRKRRGEITQSSHLDVHASMWDFDEFDKDKLDSMVYRRVVFTKEDWQKHRSSGRHFRHILSILNSRVIGSLLPPVTSVTGIAVLVVAWNEMLLLQHLPPWLPYLKVPALPFILTAPALSFLLVFRTNTSYSRFSEARKLWGHVLNRSRDLARQALCYLARGPHACERPKLMQLLRHVQAFPLALKYHLLNEGSLKDDLKNETKLTATERDAIVSARHAPNYILHMIGECLSACHLDPMQRQSMDQNLTAFADDLGGCERLFKTPIPLSYTRLTSRFLVLWHCLLPLALWSPCRLATVPAAFLSASALFCIEEVGVLIEEPFSLLALDAIALTARRDVQELIDSHGSVQKRVVDDDGELEDEPPEAADHIPSSKDGFRPPLPLSPTSLTS